VFDSIQIATRFALKFVIAAQFTDRSASDHGDLVGRSDGGKTMGNGHAGDGQ